MRVTPFRQCPFNTAFATASGHISAGMTWQNCRMEHRSFHGHNIATLHMPFRALPAFAEVRQGAAKQPATKGEFAPESGLHSCSTK